MYEEERNLQDTTGTSLAGDMHASVHASTPIAFSSLSARSSGRFAKDRTMKCRHRSTT
jgi:hypothetical protein